jgi:hypothetical protein
MKQFFWRSILGVAALCMAGMLFAILSSTGVAQAAATRATGAAISCPGITYSPGHVWHPGDYDSTEACDGGHLHLTYQTDGNFVLYCYGTALWATGTENIGGAPDYTSFQTDGNLVVYTAYHGYVGPIWSSGTYGEGATRLVLQGDGNLVIYNGNHALWATGTNGRC